ncbi:hypothetical protein BDV06DRAFT_190326 [Aspergillus oleicola]
MQDHVWSAYGASTTRFEKQKYSWTRNDCCSSQRSATIPVFHPFLELICRLLPPNLWAETLIGPKMFDGAAQGPLRGRGPYILAFITLSLAPFLFLLTFCISPDTLVLLLSLLLNSTRRPHSSIFLLHFFGIKLIDHLLAPWRFSNNSINTIHLPYHEHCLEIDCNSLRQHNRISLVFPQDLFRTLS